MIDYRAAIEQAPPGWRRFSVDDVARLPREQLENVPAEELAAAAAGDSGAAERVRRALFWPLVYEYAPELWDRLAGVEPLHPGVLAALRIEGRRVVEIGAGGGRLTLHLVGPASEVVCVEPSAGLRRLLSRRFPDVQVLAGYARELPLPDAWTDVVVACASVGPDPGVVAEMERVTRAGGTLALISPTEPEWFTDRGWSRISFDPAEVSLPPHDPALEEIFGPPDPPHELVWRRR